MARSTKKEALETRSRILDAAEDVFHARGVSHTSLADIAEAAGLTRGAIYWHFENKGDLFNAMCERVKLPLEAIMDAENASRDADPLGQFLRNAVQVLQRVAKDSRSRKVFDILFNKCEYVDPDDPIVVRQRAGFMVGKTKIKRTLLRAVAQKQLPADLDINLGYVMVHAAFSGLLHDWLFAPGNFDLLENADRLFTATIYMLKMAPTLRESCADPTVDPSDDMRAKT
jgi:TetR/AcrR family acrAB operon transcriptional repressor